MKFNTKAIHAGVEPDSATGAIMTPIYQTSTYVQESPGVHKGFEYSRSQNPTRQALEHSIAALENGKYGACFASGLAATDTLMKLFSPGDEIISVNDLYGGTYRIFSKTYERYGLEFQFVDLSKAAQIEQYLSSKTKMIWLETPTNPMLNIIDIEAITKIAKAKGILVVVDNTFASPYLQQPLALGADIVIHSATKYLGGHSDVILGATVCNDPAISEQIVFNQNASGAVPGPMDCFLILRGIKTLHLRVQRACENASVIAHALQGNPKVDTVYWPGFKSHPNHAIAAKQMSNFGGMVSFSMKDDSLEAATKVLSSTKLFTLAESLGGVESLIGHPASMTHASIPLEKRQETGVVDSLIRLSVGVEDASDLVDDLMQAIG